MNPDADLDDFIEAYTVQYEDTEGPELPEGPEINYNDADADLNEFAQTQEYVAEGEMGEDEFQIGYKDLENYSGNRATVDTPENKFLFDIAELFRNKNEALLDYLLLIQELPKFSLKNKDVLAAALEVLNSDFKTDKEKYKKYELYAKKYNVPITDVHRYYKLITTTQKTKKKEIVPTNYGADVSRDIRMLKKFKKSRPSEEM